MGESGGVVTTTRRGGKSISITLEGVAIAFPTAWTYNKTPSFASRFGAGENRPSLSFFYFVESGTFTLESAGDDTLQRSITDAGALYVEELKLFEDGVTKHTADDVWVYGGTKANRTSMVTKTFQFISRL